MCEWTCVSVDTRVCARESVWVWVGVYVRALPAAAEEDPTTTNDQVCQGTPDIPRHAQGGYRPV